MELFIIVNVLSVLKISSSSSFQFLIKLLGIKDFAPSNWLVKLLADTICYNHVTESICSNIMFLMCGYDTSNLNDVRYSHSTSSYFMLRNVMLVTLFLFNDYFTVHFNLYTYKG